MVQSDRVVDFTPLPSPETAFRTLGSNLLIAAELLGDRLPSDFPADEHTIRLGYYLQAGIHQIMNSASPNIRADSREFYADTTAYIKMGQHQNIPGSELAANLAALHESAQPVASESEVIEPVRLASRSLWAKLSRRKPGQPTISVTA